jgi:hypothetical protein
MLSWCMLSDFGWCECVPSVFCVKLGNCVCVCVCVTLGHCVCVCVCVCVVGEREEISIVFLSCNEYTLLTNATSESASHTHTHTNHRK